MAFFFLLNSDGAVPQLKIVGRCNSCVQRFEHFFAYDRSCVWSSGLNFSFFRERKKEKNGASLR